MDPSQKLSAQECLKQARAAGILLWVKDNQLLYRCPEAALTPDLRSLLGEHKVEVVNLLLKQHGRLGRRRAKRTAKQKADYPSLTPKMPFAMPGALWNRLGGARDQHTLTTFTKTARGFIPLSGVLDLEALERAVRSLVDRHDVIEGRIDFKAGQPWWVPEGAEPLCPKVIDVSNLAEDECAAALEVFNNTVVNLGQSISKINALKKSPSDHTVCLSIHSVFADSNSVNLLLAELKQLYDGHRAGLSMEKSARPVQLAEYFAGAADWLESPGGQRSKRYLHSQIEGFKSMILPGANLVSAVDPSTVTLTFTLDDGLRRTLLTLGRRADLSLNALFVAAQALALQRYRPDTPLWLDIADNVRGDRALRDVVGMLSINTPIKLETANLSPAEVLSHVRQTLRKAKLNALPVGAYDEVMREMDVEWDAPWFKIVNQERRHLPDEPQRKVMQGTPSLRAYALKVINGQNRMTASVSYPLGRYEEPFINTFWVDVLAELAALEAAWSDGKGISASP